MAEKQPDDTTRLQPHAKEESQGEGKKNSHRMKASARAQKKRNAALKGARKTAPTDESPDRGLH